MRENVQFSWVGLAQVSLWGEFLLFILSLGYRWTPAWSRVGFCYKLDIRGTGKSFVFISFWCAKEKWECSRNSLWLNFCEAGKLDNSLHCVASGVMGFCGFLTHAAPGVDILAALQLE